MNCQFIRECASKRCVELRFAYAENAGKGVATRMDSPPSDFPRLYSNTIEKERNQLPNSKEVVLEIQCRDVNSKKAATVPVDDKHTASSARVDSSRLTADLREKQMQACSNSISQMSSHLISCMNSDRRWPPEKEPEALEKPPGQPNAQTRAKPLLQPPPKPSFVESERASASMNRRCVPRPHH